MDLMFYLSVDTICDRDRGRDHTFPRRLVLTSSPSGTCSRTPFDCHTVLVSKIVKKYVLDLMFYLTLNVFRECAKYPAVESAVFSLFVYVCFSLFLFVCFSLFLFVCLCLFMFVYVCFSLFLFVCFSLFMFCLCLF